MNAPAAKTERRLLVLVPIVLIYAFARRVFFAETESASAGVSFLTILFDGAMVVGVVGLTLRRLKYDGSREGPGAWLVLPILGLLAGLGLFVIRIGGADEPALPPPAAEANRWQTAVPELERESGTGGSAPSIDAPMLTQNGGRLAVVVQAIRRQFRPGRIFKEITISREGVSIVVQDTQDPKRPVSYFANVDTLSQDGEFKSSATGSLFAGGEVRETELFSVDEADWTRVPAITRAALEKVPLPGSRVFEVALVRRLHPLQENPTEWKVSVTAGGLIGGERGNAFFNAMTSEVTEIELPERLVKPAAYFEPQNTRTLLATILQDFGPETRFTEFSIEDERALLTATRPQHPGDLRRYGYTATERAKLGKHKPVPVDDPNVRDVIFTAAEVAEFAPHFDDFRQRAFERLRMKDGKLQKVAFWREHLVHGQSKKLLVELRCVSPSLGDGSVIYELSGREFYVAVP